MNTALSLIEDLDLLYDPALLHAVEVAEQLIAYVHGLATNRVPRLLADGVDPVLIAKQLDVLIARMAVVEIQGAIQFQAAQEKTDGIHREVEQKGGISGAPKEVKELMSELDTWAEGAWDLLGTHRRARRALVRLRQGSEFPPCPIETNGKEVTFRVSLMEEGRAYITEIGDETFVAIRLPEGGIDLYHLPASKGE